MFLLHHSPLLLLLLALPCSSERSFPWNTTLLQTTLEYSAASHCSNTSLEDWTCTHCYGSVSWIATLWDEQLDIFGFVGADHDNRFCFASYRGTDFGDLMNDYIDVDVFMIFNYSGVPAAGVAAGFWQAYSSIQQQHLAAMQLCVETYPQYTTILETGHSLGAALANFGAVDVAHHWPTHNLFMYVYGDPRTGNLAYAQYFDSVVPQVWRVVQERDPVPHLPPLIAEYWQIETEVWYWNQEFTFCTEGNGEDPNCSDSLVWYNPADHGTYFGVNMGCENPSTGGTSKSTTTTPAPHPPPKAK